MQTDVEKWATCTTDGCANRGLAISVITDEEATIVCGPCGNQVTDIADIKPEEGTVLPQWILDQLATQNSGN